MRNFGGREDVRKWGVLAWATALALLEYYIDISTAHPFSRDTI